MMIVAPGAIPTYWSAKGPPLPAAIDVTCVPCPSGSSARARALRDHGSRSSPLKTCTRSGWDRCSRRCLEQVCSRARCDTRRCGGAGDEQPRDARLAARVAEVGMEDVDARVDDADHDARAVGAGLLAVGRRSSNSSRSRGAVWRGGTARSATLRVRFAKRVDVARREAIPRRRRARRAQADDAASTPAGSGAVIGMRPARVGERMAHALAEQANQRGGRRAGSPA